MTDRCKTRSVVWLPIRWAAKFRRWPLARVFVKPPVVCTTAFSFTRRDLDTAGIGCWTGSARGRCMVNNVGAVRSGRTWVKNLITKSVDVTAVERSPLCRINSARAEPISATPRADRTTDDISASRFRCAEWTAPELLCCLAVAPTVVPTPVYGRPPRWRFTTVHIMHHLRSGYNWSVESKPNRSRIAVVTTAIRLRFGFDSTAIRPRDRRPFEYLRHERIRLSVSACCCAVP